MAGAALPAAELTTSGRPILLPGEIECSLLSNVELEPEGSPPPLSSSIHLRSSFLILTTHRLIFVSDSSAAAAAAKAASYVPLSSITRIFSLKKSIKSMFASPRLKFQLSVGSDGRVGGSAMRSLVVTLVMRGKDDVEAFVDKFRQNWGARAWEREKESESASSGSSLIVESTASSSGYDSRGMRVVGVAGILRREQEMWESTDKSLQEAFQDLNALMSKAKEMVMLAEKMRSKLLSAPSQAGSSNDEELGSKEEIQDWLLSVGIVSPVTKESAGALYHQQLSRQLADFVKIPLERSGGMINLIDMYCLFNRARGTELISPEDLLRACSLWENFNAPVMLRKFDSGVMVIQNKSHSDEEVFARIKSLITQPDALQMGVSAGDAAMTLGMAPAMAKEHLLTAESRGLLCRDISPDGFRFYINLFPEIRTDDIYLVKDQGIYATWIECASSTSRLE
ncbi:vacuolar protein sorting-associated protein 36 isoform X2 [Syzygium oleosum]|uniref:vacuolar protein sorting-associated protein 36 isoform X2 n=1 Tax=Syzygium oleosum TaxID=219896 RepID=UPI0011D24907|nr:vacuolar protein sorting-associated protein 36 isoform X2 [Syzygium oleosum]